MHRVLANLFFGAKKLEDCWDLIWHKIGQFNVQVVMHDFNLSLFRVTPELRSRGAEVDLGA